MTEELKNILRVAFIYATSIIGAGFASGQEIMRFFSIYKAGGFYGILLAGLLFSIIGCIVLKKVYTDRIRNYEEFLFPTFGWISGWILEVAVTVFMLCLFCVMVAGSGNVLTEMFGIPFRYSVLIMALLCMVIIMSNIKGIVTLNSFITPVLLAGILFTGLYIIMFSTSEVFNAAGLLKCISENWPVSSLLYVSYNSMLAIVMMCSLQPYLKTSATAKWGGILGGVFLCISAMVIHAAIFMFYPTAFKKELPILSILSGMNNTAGFLYAIVLWLAMISSAVMSGFGFTDRISTMLRVGKKQVTVILCAAAVPLSSFGFSRLIATVYPAFGYIGLFMIIVILITAVVKRDGRK